MDPPPGEGAALTGQSSLLAVEPQRGLALRESVASVAFGSGSPQGADVFGFGGPPAAQPEADAAHVLVGKEAWE